MALDRMLSQSVWLITTCAAGSMGAASTCAIARLVLDTILDMRGVGAWWSTFRSLPIR